MKFFLVIPLLLFVSCSLFSSKKRSIVFLHGSHFDSTVWKSVMEKLPQDKINLIALNLPQRDNPTPQSLTQLAQMACSEGPSRPATFVAHSYGGAIVNQMMGICPQKIKNILYVAAVIPRPKETPFELLTKEDQDNYVKAVIFGKEVISPRQDEFLKVMAGAPIPADIQVVTFPEPVTLGSDELVFDRKVLKDLPIGYVHTSEDKVVSMASQVKYVLRQQIRMVYSMKAGHLPMLTHAEELARIIKDFVIKNEKK